jgi:rhodanese-related sulfurtransferase
MPEAPRITAEELRRRMQAGESFTLIDSRNPQAWGESDFKAAGAIRVPPENFEAYLSRIPKGKPVVTYCT